jgi:hypothetical protein
MVLSALFLWSRSWWSPMPWAWRTIFKSAPAWSALWSPCSRSSSAPRRHQVAPGADLRSLGRKWPLNDYLPPTSTGRNADHTGVNADHTVIHSDQRLFARWTQATGSHSSARGRASWFSSPALAAPVAAPLCHSTATWQRERPNLSLVTIASLVPSTLSMRDVARHSPSLTCSNATPKHRVAEAASESYYAIWIRPFAASSEA